MTRFWFTWKTKNLYNWQCQAGLLTVHSVQKLKHCKFPGHYQCNKCQTWHNCTIVCTSIIWSPMARVLCLNMYSVIHKMYLFCVCVVKCAWAYGPPCSSWERLQMLNSFWLHVRKCDTSNLRICNGGFPEPIMCSNANCFGDDVQLWGTSPHKVSFVPHVEKFRIKKKKSWDGASCHMVIIIHHSSDVCNI